MNDNGPLDHLIKTLASLPGTWNRSARRVALHLLTKRTGALAHLSQSLTNSRARCL